MIVVKLLGAWAALSLLILLLMWRERHVHAKASAVILRLLADDHWWYGLALVKASAGVLKRGTVYVHLGQMEDEGLVDSRREARKPLNYIGIPRRQYRITEVGRQRIELE